MTITPLRRWLGALLLPTPVLALLAGCGGGTGDETQTQIRLLNASPDLTAANLYTGSDQRAAGVAPDTISGYTELDPDSYTLRLTDAIGVTLATATQDLSKETRYTAIAWGRSGATSMTVLTEADSDTDGMNTGWGRLRVFNSAGKEAGNLDIYLVANSTGAIDLSTATPVMAGTTTTVTSYSDLLAGTYRLVVTAAGNTDDVRLDLSNFGLGDRQMLTLVLEPSAGGSLVHSLVLAHQGAMVATKNPSARVRLVASVASAASGVTGGVVTASVGGKLLSGGPLTSPQIGKYTLVPTGPVNVEITAGSTVVPPDSRAGNFASGADYTLLATGSVASPSELTILDQNRLPTNSARAKIRLVNGFGTDTAVLTVDSVSIATETSPHASDYVQIAANTTANASVVLSGGTSPWPTDPNSTTTIAQGGVYTLFLLAGKADGTALGQYLAER